ncbi:MAG: hypothetical protein ACQESR_14860 [Planctomycetota bacterium]
MIKEHALFWLIMVAGAAVISVALEVARRRRLQKYWVRTCAGPQWRESFPDAPKEDIRSFLNAFVSAFGFNRKRRLQFSPGDEILDVYRSVYPPGSIVDSMELESLTLVLEREYGLDYSTLNQEDLTLGRLFEMTRNPNKTPGHVG